jgi:hypothetical protein
MVCSSQTCIGKSRLEVDAKRSEALDKNEVSTESLGLGSFPTLLTVSYSTNYSAMTAAASPPPPPPTDIFPHRYDENDQAFISNKLVSHARRGKQVVSQLLHDVPSHYGLRPLALDTTSSQDIVSTSEQWRISFLKNGDEEEAGDGMVFVTYQTPNHEVDALHVGFGHNLEATSGVIWIWIWIWIWMR